MLRIQFHKTASDNSNRFIIAGNPNLLTVAAHDLNNQMQYQIEYLMVIRIILFEIIHGKVFIEILVVSCELICPVDFLSTKTGRKERISITQISIISISIITLCF